MITRAIQKAYETAKSRGWDRTYWAIDLHETVLKPTYTKEPATEFYPSAIRCLKELSERPDVKLILYTSSHDIDIQYYHELLQSHGVWFDYVNENPEVPNNHYGCFDRKFYFNVLVDDKAGFDAENEWGNIGWTMGLLPVLTLAQ